MDVVSEFQKPGRRRNSRRPATNDCDRFSAAAIGDPYPRFTAFPGARGDGVLEVPDGHGFPAQGELDAEALFLQPKGAGLRNQLGKRIGRLSRLLPQANSRADAL